MPKTTNPLQQRKASASPVSSAKRVQKRKKTSLDTVSEFSRLDDTGRATSLAPPGVAQDVATLMRYIHAHMWAPIPDRGAGMNSERISEILRFREALPRITSLAHLHALSASSTETERELARMVARCAIRKVVIPGRGKGGASVGEGVVLAEDWKTKVHESGMRDEATEKYLSLLDSTPDSVASTVQWADDEVKEVVAAGYFTSPTALSAGTSALFAPPGESTLAHSGSTAATGTLAAVGGLGAIHSSGGGGSVLTSSAPRSGILAKRNMIFSLPSTGAYLKLLVACRSHLLFLLKQISPRYQEATYSLLQEKWEGNIANDAASRAKRARGEWSGVLPGKTKMWKEFYGLEFRWVLEECVGSGLVEIFETGSVGWGVRAI